MPRYPKEISGRCLGIYLCFLVIAGIVVILFALKDNDDDLDGLALPGHKRSNNNLNLELFEAVFHDETIEIQCTTPLRKFNRKYMAMKFCRYRHKVINATTEANPWDYTTISNYQKYHK